MWKRYYRRPYYKRNYYSNPLEDFIDLVVTLYVFYLVYLFFTDKINFWRWISYGVIAVALLVGIRLIINKLKNKTYSRNFFPYRSYFRNQPETPEERKLGNLLKNKGWNVKHQQWDGYKHIDIAIPEAKMNIEVEGSQHNLNPEQALTDQKRDYYSSQKGFETKRVPNSLLRDDVRAEEEAEILDKYLRERVDRLRK